VKPKNIKRLQAQGKELNAHILNRHTLAVASATSPLANHIVTVEYGPDGTIHARCTCPWAINGGVACSHVIAALERLANTKGRTLSFWTSKEEAERQKHRVFYLAGERDDEGVWITSRNHTFSEN
jgi:uncharacterized Zn finger protein